LYSEYIIYAILTWKVLAVKFLKVEQYNIQLYFQQYKSDLKLQYVGHTR
jgi:hypothetical protein